MVSGIIQSSPNEVVTVIYARALTYFLEDKKMSSFNDLNGTFGPELSFLTTLAKANPNQKIIGIKYAVGGTSLAKWLPLYFNNQGQFIVNSNPLYNRLIQYIRQALKTSDTKQFDYKALIWMQGESDAVEFNQIGTKHSENLKQLFSLIKKDLSAPALSFVLGQIYEYQLETNSDIPSQIALNSIRNQQAEFSNKNDNVYLVPIKSFTLLDPWHFNGSSLLALGSCFEKAYRTKNNVLCYDGLYQIYNPLTTIGPRAFFSSGDFRPQFGFKYGNNIQLCLDSVSPKDVEENFSSLEGCTEVNAAESACENPYLWTPLPRKSSWTTYCKLPFKIGQHCQ